MVELQTLDGTVKNAQQQFTVTDTWQRFTLTFKGNTAGTINNDNGPGLEVKFWLHAGSDFSSGTYTAGEFSNNTSADRAVGIDSIADSTSRTLLFTGWQLEVGNSATPFEHRSYGEELALCQRYYLTRGDSSNIIYHYHDVTSGQTYYHTQTFPATMRASPTVTVENESLSRFDGITAWKQMPSGFGVYDAATSSGRGGFGYSYIADAEL